MTSVSNKLISEGDSHIKEAEKLCTKTMFRWKPDWENATPIYEKAATCYRNAKAFEKAKSAFIKAAEGHLILKTNYSAAKNYDGAGAMAKELDQNDQAAELFEKAANLFRSQEGSETAAETLIKAAKLLEETNPEKAIKLCKEALEIYETDDKDRFSGPAFKYSLNMFLKNNRIEDSLEILKKRIEILTNLKNEHDTAKAILSIIILYLVQDDFVAADRIYKEYSSHFTGTQESIAAAELLEAIENRNQEALQKCLSKQLFSFLDNEVYKITKQLKSKAQAVSGDKPNEEEEFSLA